MVGVSEGAFAPHEVEPQRAVRASETVNWALAILMMAILVGAVAGVVVALSSGMPNLALMIALVTGAVFAGIAC